VESLRWGFLRSELSQTENIEEGKRLGKMQKRVKVKPNSKQQRIEEEPDGNFTVYLKLLPVDGKANETLLFPLWSRFQQWLVKEQANQFLS
jgi:uncharacterized protein YggU (UPF0235/DUF167 family)